ncbi:MAG: beta-ketoacyl synthase N-terminal-like domain-containing protein [Burkholderiales bacterium]
MRRRVAVTGLGIVSCLGNELRTVAGALRSGASGVRFCEEYRRAGMRSHVAGLPQLGGEAPIERKRRRFMGEVSVYAYHALRKAIDDARLTERRLSSSRTGLIVGSGVGSLSRYVEALDTLRASGMKKLSPYVVPQTMASTASACLASAFCIGGVSYSISGACASAAHALGQGAELIRSGRQDLVLAGGAEEAAWTSAVMFDAMHALSTGHNDRPQAASRPYDVARDGFVMAGGAGMLVLEELEHARARGAHCYGEVCGYGASSGGDMVALSGAAAAAAMRAALAEAGPSGVDYVNAHAISSVEGDRVELEALREVFPGPAPLVSSTKGLSGHSLAASGAQEAIYCLLMMADEFVAGCANLEQPDAAALGLPLVAAAREHRIARAMSNSFGFGGTNASLVFGLL